MYVYMYNIHSRIEKQIDSCKRAGNLLGMALQMSEERVDYWILLGQMITWKKNKIESLIHTLHKQQLQKPL